MKAVIDRKIYDTATAEKIFEDWNGLHDSDFRYRSYELYRTPRGAWFMVNAGGPATDMRVAYGGGMIGSTAIEPMDESEVIDFLSEHGGAETIEEYFPGVIEEAGSTAEPMIPARTVAELLHQQGLSVVAVAQALSVVAGLSPVEAAQAVHGLDPDGPDLSR